MTFSQKIQAAVNESTLVKITLSKKTDKSSDLNNVYIRLVLIKDEPHLSFTYRHQTKDVVKNFDIEDGIDTIEKMLGNAFLNGVLLTTNEDVTIQYNRKRIPKMRTSPPTHDSTPNRSHDKKKQRLVAPDAPFLQKLGIASTNGKVLKDKQAKYKQINKYIEIIDGLLRSTDLPETVQIVDMGSGKGYLTFALYDYLVNHQKRKVTLTGIELRQNLVDFCNQVTQEVGFEGLSFVASDIHEYENDKIDILIALHACDIATDIAIAKGIKADAQLIICAPCCHKQIRQQMDCQNDLQHILKHGILEERQAEMITDGIRALTLEGHGYQSKVFEFISSEHTAKNLMIVGSRVAQANHEAFDKIARIKTQFGIEYHYIEQLLEVKA